MRRIVFLLPVLFAACNDTPSSLVPLAPITDAILDERFVGEWKLESARQQPELRAIVSTGTLEDVVVEISKESSSTYTICFRHRDTQLSFQGRLHRINGATYLSLQRPAFDDLGIAGTTIRPYFFAKCSVQADQIRLIGCEAYRFKKQLQQHGLPFVEVDAATVFTGKSDQLRELIHEHSDELFPQRTGDAILRKPASQLPKADQAEFSSHRRRD